MCADPLQPLVSDLLSCARSTAKSFSADHRAELLRLEVKRPLKAVIASFVHRQMEARSDLVFTSLNGRAFVEDVPRARAATAASQEGHFPTQRVGLLESLSPFRTSWLVNTIQTASIISIQTLIVPLLFESGSRRPATR